MMDTIARVTMTVDFLILSKIQAANGQTVAEILIDWFKDPNRYHASRDAFQIGNSKRIINVEIVDPPSD